MSILMNAICDSTVSNVVYDDLKAKAEIDQTALAEAIGIRVSLEKQVAAKKTEINDIVSRIRAVIVNH